MYPSQRKRRAVMVDAEYRTMLNKAARRDGITAKEAAEALIELYASGDVEIIRLVKARLAQRPDGRGDENDD